MNSPPSRHWHHLTSPEIEQLVAQDPVVVLPLAAIEQHGPHLPLSTDLVIGEGILAEAISSLPAGFPVATLPPQSVGASLEHQRLAGTISLAPNSLSQVVQEIGVGLARHGVRRLVLSNSHGGNKHVVDSAALYLRERCNLLVVKAHYFRFPRPEGALLPESEWNHGLHGGALETAMMLELAPHLVRSDRIGDHRSLGQELERSMAHVGPEGVAPFAWLAGDLSDSGVTGNATLGTAELGRKLVAHYGDFLATVIRDAKEFPVHRLV